MDPLENSIKALQEAMQSVEQPDKPAIWQGISRPDARAKNGAFKVYFRWAAAAAVLLLGACTLFWWENTRTQRLEAATLAQLPAEWQFKTRECQLLVKHYEQKAQLHRRDTTAIADEIRVLQEVSDLQASFLADFETLPKDHRTAARYLRYYEQKIRIMELIFKKIEIHQYEEERSVHYRS